MEERMMKIYGVPISVHTRKVIVAAIEKNLPYELDPVIPFNPPAGWDELSPTGKIPVCTIGDLTLRDSAVICAYLERKHPEPALYPKDDAAYAQARWFEEYAGGTIFRDVVHGLFFQKIIRPNILKQSTDTAVIDGILKGAMPKTFAYLERSLGSHHLAGDRLSIADIAVTSNLINYHYLGYRIDRRQYPRLAAFFDSMLRQPSIARALQQEQKVAAGLGLDQSFLKELAAA
jgi:glutathione S-transferase